MSEANKEKTLHQLQRDFFHTWRKLYRQDFEKQIADLRRKNRELEQKHYQVVSALVKAINEQGVSLKKICVLTKCTIWFISWMRRMAERPTLESNGNSPVKAGMPVHIDELRLGIRSYNALSSAGLTEVSKICAHTQTELLRYRNFGRSCLGEVQSALAENGLSLRDPDSSLTT